MPRSHSLLALATIPLAVGLLGVQCATRIEILRPLNGAAFESLVVPIRIAVGGGAAPGALQTTLNGTPLTLKGGPSIFHTDVSEEDGLTSGTNVLRARVAGVGLDAWAINVERSFHWDPPPDASAFEITNPADLITGPLAHGRVGDYMLENGIARFIIQDVGQRDMYSVGEFGGNLIDVELVADPGRDNFLELQPALNIETVINAQTVEIVNDGSDGNAAIVRTCGPDDLLDFINPSTNLIGFGFEPPAAADDVNSDVTGCTDYTLEPGVSWLRITTTVENHAAARVRLFVGDFLNAAGEVAPWAISTQSPAGGGVGEALTGTLRAFSYIGFGDATGVEYGLVATPYDGGLPTSDYLTAAGVTVLLQSASIIQAILTGKADFRVPAGETRSFTRYFVVGDASRGNTLGLDIALNQEPAGTVRGCVTLEGEPAPGARVALTQRFDDEFTNLDALFVTDADGCYEGLVPEGRYALVVERHATPFEGGANTPLVRWIDVLPDSFQIQHLQLPSTGRIQVSVIDEDDAPIPARVSVIGFDPSPQATIRSEGVIQTNVTGVFRDHGRDDLPFGFVAAEYAGADGNVVFDLEPGNYWIHVSRGHEYSLFRAPLSIDAGETSQLQAQIGRVLDTVGFVSSDFHVHGIMSADSSISNRNRVMQFAGEGVDNIVMTEHNARNDIRPTIDALSLTPFVNATVGEEITTWDYGHFNGYPLLVDPSRPSGGSTDWGFDAPPGESFPSLGNYILTPAELDAKARTGTGSTPETLVQINHISSTFVPLKIDTTQVPPSDALTPEEKLAMRLDPASGNLYHHFAAMEMVNGAGRGSQSGFFNGAIGVWFNHLSQGLHVTGLGVSDTHGFQNLNGGGARTWTASPTDAPALIDPQDVAASVTAGRAVVGMGLFVTAELVAADGSEARATLQQDGSTLVASSNGAVDLEIRVQSPSWAPFDRIEIYRNASTTPTTINDGVPVMFSSSPQQVLEAGSDFVVDTVMVHPTILDGERLEANLTVPFTGLSEDAWFVVLARGSDGVSEPGYPVLSHNLDSATNLTLDNLVDGNLGEGGVTALGFTNPLYADVDGQPGFDPPASN